MQAPGTCKDHQSVIHIQDRLHFSLQGFRRSAERKQRVLLGRFRECFSRP